MIRSLIIFTLGVWVGQEYGNVIPNVKLKSYEMYESLKTTDLYKKIIDDLNKR
jgi:hypothetical protein